MGLGDQRHLCFWFEGFGWRLASMRFRVSGLRVHDGTALIVTVLLIIILTTIRSLSPPSRNRSYYYSHVPHHLYPVSGLRSPSASKAARMGDLGNQLPGFKSRRSLTGYVCACDLSVCFTYVHNYIHTYLPLPTDRQPGREAGRQADGLTDGHTDRRTRNTRSKTFSSVES